MGDPYKPLFIGRVRNGELVDAQPLGIFAQAIEQLLP